MPKELSATARVQVRFSEVDSIKMVWHGHYVKYIEDAREAFGRKYGLEYIYIFDSGYLAPVVDLHLRHYNVATVNDVLLVKATYHPALGAKLIFDFEIRRESDDELILKATSTQLFTTAEGEFSPSCPPFFEEWKHKYGYK